MYSDNTCIYMYMLSTSHIHVYTHIAHTHCIKDGSVKYSMLFNLQIEMLYSTYCANHPKAVAVLTDNSYVHDNTQTLMKETYKSRQIPRQQPFKERLLPWVGLEPTTFSVLG